MLFVCIMLLFFAIDFCNSDFCFLFLCFVFVYWHSLFISFFISIMHSAFNLFVFPNSMFTPLLLIFYIWKRYELSGEIALRNNHYYYYYISDCNRETKLKNFLWYTTELVYIVQYIVVWCSVLWALRGNSTYKLAYFYVNIRSGAPRLT